MIIKYSIGKIKEIIKLDKKPAKTDKPKSEKDENILELQEDNKKVNK